MGFRDGSMGKEYACNAGDTGMETHTSILEIPMDRGVFGLQFMGLSSVRHD